MGTETTGTLRVTPHYHEIMGRAAEIARASGSPLAGAGHLFLAMAGDSGWPVAAIAGLADLPRAGQAVRDLLDGPGCSPSAAPGPGSHAEPWGASVAAEMGDGYLGAEHALLAMLRDRQSIPARALAGLADLDVLDAAIVAAKDAPVTPGANAAVLPEGQQLDGPLLQAIGAALPAGARAGYNTGGGKAWLIVLGPDGLLGGEASRQVLQEALARLEAPGRDQLL